MSDQNKETQKNNLETTEAKPSRYVFSHTEGGYDFYKVPAKEQTTQENTSNQKKDETPAPPPTPADSPKKKRSVEDFLNAPMEDDNSRMGFRF